MSQTTKYIIYFLLLVILGCSIGIGIDIWLKDESCDDKKEPTNLDECKNDDNIRLYM